jgi:hypothetical protein
MLLRVAWAWLAAASFAAWAAVGCSSSAGGSSCEARGGSCVSSGDCCGSALCTMRVCQAADTGSSILGSYWDQTEADGACHGTWTRQGQTSTFSAEWPDCSHATATVTVTINGSQVSIARVSSDNSTCSYTGTLGVDQTSVSGTYFCTRTRAWSAIIHP